MRNVDCHIDLQAYFGSAFGNQPRDLDFLHFRLIFLAHLTTAVDRVLVSSLVLVARVVFTARRLAKRGICRRRVSVCLCVCVCVCHLSLIHI